MNEVSVLRTCSSDGEIAQRKQPHKKPSREMRRTQHRTFERQVNRGANDRSSINIHNQWDGATTQLNIFGLSLRLAALLNYRAHLRSG